MSLQIIVPDVDAMDRTALRRAMLTTERVMRSWLDAITFEGPTVTVHLDSDGQCALCRSTFAHTVQDVFARHGHYVRPAWRVAGWPTDEPCSRHAMALALVTDSAE